MRRLLDRLRARLGEGERGALAPAFPIIILALFALGGLVVDGSRDLSGRGQAQAYAEEAARAGAQQIDEGYAGVRLLPESVVSAAVDAFCDRLRQSDQLRPGDQCAMTAYDQNKARVEVTVQMAVPTTILQAFGIGDFSVSGRGTAQAVQGISGVGH
jgi:Flp pilus assembly protein TadG